MTMKSTSRLRWPILILTLLAAVAGFFLRRSQLAATLPDGAPGNRAHIYLLILSVAVAVVLAVLLFPLTRQRSWKSVFAYKPAFHLLLLAAAVALLVGNLLLWIIGLPELPVEALTAPAISRALGKILAPFGVLSALCIALFALRGLYGKRPSALFYIAATLYLVVRLILSFQRWNTDPWIHDYCYELMAYLCCTLAVVQLAGFCFDAGKRRITLFWCLMGTVFSTMTVADHLHSGSVVENLINIALLLILLTGGLQLLFCDLRPEPTEKPGEEAAQPPQNQ